MIQNTHVNPSTARQRYRTAFYSIPKNIKGKQPLTGISLQSFGCSVFKDGFIPTRIQTRSDLGSRNCECNTLSTYPCPHSTCSLCRPHIAMFFQIVQHRSCHVVWRDDGAVRLGMMKYNLCLCWRLVGVVNTSKLLDLPLSATI